MVAKSEQSPLLSFFTQHWYLMNQMEETIFFIFF